MGEQARYLTYMFCDLVGSTELTRRSDDPEAAFELVHGFQSSCAKQIEAFDGFVARYMGDSVLAYFGYPVASDASAEAAVRCALKIREAVASVDARLQVRTGIANGRGILSELQMGSGTAEMAVVSDATNLAARLESLAQPGEILVSSQIHAQVGNLFECSAAQNMEVKGYENQQEVYRVLGDAGYASVSQQRDEQVETPCLGRQTELQHVLMLWQQMRDSNAGRSLLVQGPAGIGKTSFARELRQQLGEESLKLKLYSSQFEKHTALHPLKVFFAVLWPGDAIGQLRDWLVANLGAGDWAQHEQTIGLMLGHRQEALAPHLLRERILQGLVDLLLALGKAQPLLLTVEDLHWLDATSIELLARLQQAHGMVPVFVLATTRPEPAAAAMNWDLQLELRPLNEAHVESLLGQMDGAGQLDARMRKKIAAKAGGVPLLVREFARAAIVGADSGDSTDLVVPEDLLQSFLAQIDSWQGEREIIDVAASIGHGFNAALIANALDSSEEEVARVLNELTANDLLVAYFTPQGTAYNFSHMLLGEAAYSTLLRKQREDLHGRVLAALQLLDPQVAENQPAQVAHHLQATRQYAEAIGVLLQAGYSRFAASQFSEAAGLADQAESMLADIDDPATKAALALQLYTLRGLALTQLLGFSDPAVSEAYEHAEAICRELHQSGAPEFNAIWGIWSHKLVVSETREAVHLTHKMHDVAVELENVDLRMLASCAQVVMDFCLGEFEHSQASFDYVMEHYDLIEHARLALSYSQDPKCIALMFAAHSSAATGDLKRGDWLRAEAINHAAGLSVDFLVPYTNIFSQASRIYYGADEALLADLDANIAMAQELALPFWVLSGSLWKGAALAQLGQHEEAIALMRPCLQEADATGLSLMIPYLRGVYAASLTRLGRHEEARPLFEQAIAASSSCGETGYLAELQRMHAVSLLEAGDAGAAQPVFEQALKLACEQKALGWEGRILQTLLEHDLLETLYADRLADFRSRLQNSPVAQQTWGLAMLAAI